MSTANTFHRECWQVVQRASALGLTLSYLPHGDEANPRRVVECCICGDRWVVEWRDVRHVLVVRRAMLGILLRTPLGAGRVA
jgi:hypothetical protein